jgi:hypothetical protein
LQLIRTRRIRSLEAHVAEIRQTQTAISNSLAELVHHLRSGGLPARSPSIYHSSTFQQSPSLKSPSISTPTASHQHVSPPAGTTASFPTSHGSNVTSLSSRPQRASLPNASHQGPSTQAGDDSGPTQLPPMYGNYPQGTQNYNVHGTQGPVLPPFSSIQTMGPPHSNTSSVRYQSSDSGYQRSAGKIPVSGSKRHAPRSNVTSADSSDIDDDDGGELPASGLVAPWEVLRGLADDAAAKVETSVPPLYFVLTRHPGKR